MKIPQVLATTPTGVGPAAYASPEAFGQGAGQLARGLHQVEVAANRATSVMREAEAELLALTVRTEVAQQRSRFELGLKEFDANLRVTATDPADYMAKYDAGVKERLEALEAAGLRPETLTALQPHLARIAGEHRGQALGHRNVLVKSSTNARIDDTVELEKRLAREIPLSDHKAWADHVARAEAAVGLGAGVNGADATGDRQRRVFAEMLEDRARAHAKEDPDGFQRDGASLYGALLGRAKLDDLGDVAARRIEARNKEADRQQQQLDAKTKQLLLEGRDRTAIQARRLYDAGTLTFKWIEDAEDTSFLTAEKSEHFRELLQKPPKEVAPDPALVARMAVQVHSTLVNRDRASTMATQRQVEELVRTNQIPYKGLGQSWLSHLETVTRHYTEQARSEGRTDAERAQARQREGLTASQRQAEQQIDADLRITSPYQNLVVEADVVKASALREMASASGAPGMGGDQNPQEWWAKNRTRFIAQLAKRAAAEDAMLRRNLPYANVAALRAARLRTRMSDEEYYRHLENLEQLAKLNADLDMFDARMKGVSR